jgi:hypothetical protein
MGSLLVARLQAAAFKRATMPEHERIDFHLAIDEFQNFMTESFASILSEARKYRLNLILAHQYLDQAKPAVRDAVFGNVGSMIAFRVGGPDGETLVQLPIEGGWNHAALATTSSHLAITLATDFVDH